MVAFSTLKRLAKLTGWLGLSVGAMVAASCGALLSSACGNASLKVKDAGPDATAKSDAAYDDVRRIVLPEPPPDVAKPDAAVSEAGAVDTEPAADANQNDLWNTPCE